MTRPILRVPVGFAPAAIDKVERLLELLGAFREDRELHDLFVLHGGTALNLFHDDAPRLSVDIDLMFVGAADVAEMRERRPDVDARIRRVVNALGYVVQGKNSEHSGQTYRIKYPGDYVKVDISYLARVPLLEPEDLVCGLSEPSSTFPVLQLPELVAGKVKAMVERMAARDLFDLYRLAMHYPGAFSSPLSRSVAVYALGASDPFPRLRDPVLALERFREPPADFVDPLYAMLRASDTPGYEEMLFKAGEWLKPLSTLSDSEREYMDLLDVEGSHRPELLFSQWPEVLDRARRDPVMAWKVQNLSRRT